MINRMAKEIRDEMTTAKAGCYRLEKLPKSATVKSIAMIIEALSVSTEDSHPLWEKVFETKLYRDNSPEYCHILAHICRTRNLEKV